MAIPGVTDVSQLTYKTTTRQYLDREGLIEYTSKIKSKIAEDITADLGKKITAESEARAAGDSALQQSINNLPAKAYSKITAVSGSTTTAVEASGKDSELKLKAGSNVALGVDTANKTITINATDTKYVAATTSAPGLMSKEDKVKLDGIATNANKYTLPPATSTALGGVMVPANSGIELASDGKISLTKDKLVQMIGAFAGATATTAGQVGLVPAPTKASTSLYLKSDGTWGTPPNTNTTYTLSPGKNNGTLKLTPSSGSAQDNIKVTGLGDLAYKNSLSASDVGALSTGADYIASATVNGNTLTLKPNGKTAVTFTNSVYDKFIGATATTAGQVGLVPAPTKASTSLYLKSDGTWGTPPNTVYTHPSSGVTAGTYRSVTVNAQGHVTKGTNPATLGDYGITDAKIVSGTITLGTATITPLTSSSVTATNNTASWGSAVVVGKVGSTDLKFTMPANPNTWRSIKVNTDTAISASTLNLVAGTNIALTTTTSGSVANVTIATSGLGTAAAKSADYFAIAGHNHDGVYIKKSGDTMTGRLTASGKISVAITGSPWIGGKTVTNAAISTSSAFDASSSPAYYPILAATTGSGNVVNIGGISDEFGFYGYLKDRTANGTDWSFRVNTATGDWTSSGQIKATQFNGPATALTSKGIGSEIQPVYFDANGKPVAISYTIEKSVPSGAVFTDTHFTTGLVTSNSATGTSNAAAINGNVYLNLKDNSTIRNSHKIIGSGATTVTSDASGTITIASTNTNTTYTLSSGTTNGTLKLTPSSGSAQDNIKVTGLGTAAYEAKTAFALTGHSHSNYVSSVKTTGTGNAITTITQNGSEITATKGSTFLTSHQDISGKANLSGATFTGAVAITNTTASSSTTTGALRVSGGIGAQGSIYGARVYNAVWNDLADCIPVDDDVELEPGRCYCFNGTNYHKSNKYLADGIIGIHSDTYGMHMGAKQGVKQMDVAVAGFVLAYVDQEYPVGTPLTCGPDGMLVKIEREDKIEYPEKIIATYWKKETEEYWGSETQKVKVNGRKWVKIK